MSRRRLGLGLPLAFLLVGCGSSHSRTATAPIATATAPRTTTTRPATTSTSPTYPAPPPVNTTTTHTNPANHSPPPPSGARIPATFTVTAEGTLTPPTISAPSGFTVQVTIRDHASRPAVVSVQTPERLHIVVPPGGSAHLDASRLPKGSYTIVVNGKPSGSLEIGAQPGP